ncbi:carbonic anhydrase [Streptomyces aureus]|uniref:carbonic anhydrase n=1 Tax=Streptomyces aureus TaxID=193461 RepID=UPI00055C64F1|nr:carbonic anhydrase [Streptomyces aureus]
MTQTQTPTPRDAFDLLMAGNQRFVSGTPEHPNQDATRRTEIAPSQQPFAVLFGCSDSRLAAEIIFDRGLGDLFVVRTAGHVAGTEVLGSIEFGVSVLNAPLVVVLGHDSCGAVAAARSALENGQTPGGFDAVAAGRLAVVGLSYRLSDGSAQLVATRGLDAELPTAS